MNKKDDRLSQRIARALRIMKSDRPKHKAGDTLVKIKSGHLSIEGQPIKIKVTEVIRALDEVENARTVSDVVSSASKAKSLLKKYRETRKACE